MRNSITVAIMAIAISAASCTKASIENTYSRQEENIDRFITGLLEENPERTVVRNKGTNRLILVNGEGPEASSGSKVTAYYTAYIFDRGLSDNNIVATNHEATAESLPQWSEMLETMSFEPVVFDLNDKTIVEGLANGLAGVKKGEECYIVFSGKYGFGMKPHGLLPANSAMLYHIWVESVE